MPLHFPQLDLSLLCEEPGMYAVNVAAGRFFVDAAAVCLEISHHSPGISLEVTGVKEQVFALNWPIANEQGRRTHADEQDATEFGACALALVLSLELTDYQAIQRSRKGTGFDYWLGKEDPDLFCARLEISGIMKGNNQDIHRRVMEKKLQTKRSEATGLPAYACVVEFSRPEARFEKV